jgi:hypothetical protein
MAMSSEGRGGSDGDDAAGAGVGLTRRGDAAVGADVAPVSSADTTNFSAAGAGAAAAGESEPSAEFSSMREGGDRCFMRRRVFSVVASGEGSGLSSE